MLYLKDGQWLAAKPYSVMMSIPVVHSSGCDGDEDSDDTGNDEELSPIVDEEDFCDDFCDEFCPAFCRAFCDDVSSCVGVSGTGCGCRRNNGIEACRTRVCTICHILCRDICVNEGGTDCGDFCNDFCRVFSLRFCCALARCLSCRSCLGDTDITDPVLVCRRACGEICPRICREVCESLVAADDTDGVPT